ncbi:MAG: hypothetical protein G3M70_14380 [Candidatus Nitronauta litoralis]|uniref:Uncharacterized protein n=1 Tax=Candidatus Nitronauta litoralis TaxID=2705533 RepID=A0A7T0BY04_9BACT|nr:MAG: hypothetical protein G3M70_14380 [Candidatus Nitronauta litoralis]
MTFKKLIQNFLLLLFSLAAGYGLLEFVLFPKFMDKIPLKLHFAVKEDIRILTQSSKDEVIPKKYIALFGDSYSQGYGDWLLDANPNRNLPHHSAHVLHDLTGHNIITFGKSGSGSLSGLVGNPINWLNYIRQSRLGPMPNPEEILVYFYEGNDLNDNLEDLKKRFINRDYDPSRVYDETYFRRFIKSEVIRSETDQKEDWKETLFFTEFLRRTIDSFENKKSTLIAPESISPGAGKINRILLNGRQVPIPDGLQSPALELTQGEIHLTTAVFEQSLKYMREHFNGIPVTVVYLPSVLSCYEVVSPYVSIQIYDSGRESNYPSYLVRQRSEEIATMIRTISKQEDARFIDARPALRALGRKQIFHGPKDWKHYNKDGYTALAKTIYEKMSPPS